MSDCMRAVSRPDCKAGASIRCGSDLVATPATHPPSVRDQWRLTGRNKRDGNPQLFASHPSASFNLPVPLSLQFFPPFSLLFPSFSSFLPISQHEICIWHDKNLKQPILWLRQWLYKATPSPFQISSFDQTLQILKTWEVALSTSAPLV